MADIVDFANDLMQERIDQAIAARLAAKPVPNLHSFLFCETCEEAIPEARRVALPGCTQCLTCQSLLELREARHAR
ncbi:TraR/DksA family transcriptional regulator [Pseudomonas syringae group genomosp. 3]|uniref:TraR/DksA family transcriptional regulator n=1 Tax=Pseudomonas syringae group genomosp. 3 TaxID=251701 RepID=UPI000EFEACE0|nr:TraR/DksA family transcriptional regulator [Pseudomonas syringae group genomosp. 3]